MRIRWLLLMALIVVTATGCMIWLGRGETTSEDMLGRDAGGVGVAVRAGLRGSNGVPSTATLRIGIIPEREIFEQRRRYALLAGEIARRLDCSVQLVTENTYEGVLSDLETGRVDAAFAGSFIAVLAMDRCGAEVLCKPEMDGGVTTYRGVLLSRADGPVESIEDLEGASIAMVRATTAADLFPFVELDRCGLLDSSRRPAIRWVGTHDAAIQELAAGRVDAAAAKDSRVAAYEARAGAIALRRLAESPEVPNNALIVRAGLDDGVKAKLKAVLLDMDEDPDGRRVLERFGAVRFVGCGASEYVAVLDMVRRIGDRWAQLGVSGDPPRLDAGWAVTGASE